MPDQKKPKRLVDVDVTHISIVDRPANRTPFKFIKRAGEVGSTHGKGGRAMHELIKNLFGRRGPRVAAVTGADEAKATLVAKHFMGDAPVKVAKDADAVTIAAEGYEPADTDIRYPFEELGLAVTVTGLDADARAKISKGVEGGWFSPDYAEAFAAYGVVPTIKGVLEALKEALVSSVYADETKSPADLMAACTAAFAAAQAHIKAILSVIPEQLFKFEQVVTAGASGAPVEGELAALFADAGSADGSPDAHADDGEAGAASGTEASGVAAEAGEAAAETTDTTAGGEGDAKQNPPADNDGTEDTEGEGEGTDGADAADCADAKADEGEGAEATPGEDGGEPVAASADEPNAAPAPVQGSADAEEIKSELQKAMAELISPMGEAIAELKKAIDTQSEAHEAEIGKLKAALGSAVPADPNADPSDGAGNRGQVVDIRNSAGAPPLIDTAFARK